MPLKEISPEEANKIFPPSDDFGKEFASGPVLRAPIIPRKHDPGVIRQVSQEEYLRSLESRLQKKAKGTAVSKREQKRRFDSQLDELLSSQFRKEEEDEDEDDEREASSIELAPFIVNGEDDTERKKREARANALKTVTDDEREETEGHSKCRCVLM